jgi:capsule polysaccharide export protein KpsC/LpsZ
MYYGKMTNELKDLIDKHEKLFGYDPTSDMELEYGQADYNDLISDIKKAIKENKPICEVVE